MKTGSYKIAETVVGHPMRPRQMVLIYSFGAQLIGLRIDAEDNLRHFFPGRAFTFRIEEAQVDRQMRAVIISEPRVRRWLVEKVGFAAHS